MGEISTLYDEDFVLWSKQQAEALRAAGSGTTNRPIDWENVAEEIESLGILQRSALKSQIGRIIEHLMKLEFSPAADPRRGWTGSIDDARNEIERVLEDSPSLRREIDAAIAAETKRTLRKAIRALEEYGEIVSATVARLRSRTYNRGAGPRRLVPPGTRLRATARRGAMTSWGATARGSALYNWLP